MPLPPPDVDRLCTVGSAYACANDEVATVVALPAAELSLPSGAMSARDPVVGLEDADEPFTATAPPGRGAVTPSVVEAASWTRPVLLPWA
ncbi:hypothetical protein AB0C76_29005 [Kitasatospora sp. NPDC048722]|uniref:hypothetical protein n=1 Tax=Kitasatospora sp. NPDC048722 TaxID=3155639 RepID=UPI0033D95975